MKKILITDDEPMMAKLAARALKNDYETLTAGSGAEALALFETEKPDLVISDVKMPGMSGFELCTAIKEKYGKAVPFVFMTADETEEAESRGKDVGAAAFIRKPVRAEAMLVAVQSVLAGGGGPATAVPSASQKSKTDLKAEKAKLPDWLLHEPLIDIDAGLANSGDADAYLSSVDIFLAHVDENVSVLCKCLEAGDRENYTIKAHGLKSTSRVIGAMVLSATAAAMERAGEGGDDDFIRREHEAFIALYRKYQRAILDHLNEEEKEEIPEEDLADAMMALKEYAMAEDYSLVEDTLNALQGCRLPEETSAMIGDVRACLNRLDWDGIRSKLGV
ncbi:MAG: response regulator [Lachnospiraceae bacterium]|nr:response regulator [Lachnospiraceae bacterium]